MEQTKKIATKKEVSSRRFWKILFVFAVAFFVFAPENDVLAQSVSCSSSTAKFKCTYVGKTFTAGYVCTATEADCTTYCANNTNVTDCTATSYETGSTTVTKVNKKGFIEGLMDSTFGTVFKTLLYGIFKLLVWLLGVAVSLFAWVVDSKNVSFIMGSEGLYQSWAMVRDFLNLGFILVLLYIAFCVIFQIGSYSDGWKKMLLMMVIMALLVNFSFPICRVIIDFSNVAFYYLLNNGFSGIDGDGGRMMTVFTDKAGLGTILNEDSSTTVAYILAMIVFTFILMITFLVIAILFVVRMVALGLLVVFSPIGFAGAAFPFSKKYASQWWDNLFKYSFFAPIMIFMMLVAFNIMDNLTTDSFVLKAQKNLSPDTGISADFLGTMAYFSIPIVILWFGMHMAQTMSIAGASAVTGTADKFAKWAGKKVTGADFAQKGWGAYSARRKQADEDRWSGRLGRLLGSQQDRLRGALPGGRDAQLRYERDVAARIKRESERNDTANMNSTQLRQLADSGDRFERAAAMIELASRNQATQNDLDYTRQIFGEGSQAFRQLQNKVKSYDPAAAFAHLAAPQRQAALLDHLNSNQFDAKKVGSSSLGNSEFMELAMSNGAISNKDIMEMKKDVSKNNAMKRGIGGIIAAGHRNAWQSEEDRNIHMANFALTGEITDDNFADHISENLDKENAANMTAGALGVLDFNKIKQGRIRDIVEGMKKNDVARDLVANLANTGTSSHAKYVRNHPTLSNYLP